MNDALLQFLLEYSCESSCGWIRFERRHVRKTSLLQGLAKVACVSKRTNLNAGFTLQLATLCLASYDVAALNVKPEEKANLVLDAFETNVVVFGKSWRLDNRVPQRLLMVPPNELGTAELQQLRVTLLSR